MRSWGSQELQSAALPDKRLNQRLIKIVENLAQQPHASVPQASGDWANTKATYNFWKSSRIKAEDIIEAHQKQTTQRASKEKIVLAIQDTSDFNFTHHRAKTEEQGFGMTCAQKYVRGLKVHSLMLSTTQGVPLGILEQQIWTRPLKKTKKKNQQTQKSILKKESKRWLTSLVSTELAIPSTTTVVTVTDREGDIYDLFALEREPNSELLIRAKHNRRVNHELKFVKQAMEQIPDAGQLKISVPRADGQKSRITDLSIRYASFDFPPPINRAKSFKHESVTLNVISATEENPPTEVKPITWFLLTSLEVNNFEQATGCIRWYTYRWVIERYHYVLKSGCRIEQLQLKTAERIKKALATYTIVAWRLLWLTYHARDNPHLPCDTILEQDEWQSLYCHFQGFPLAEEPPSIQQAMIWIARLGGFLPRNHDGLPGGKYDIEDFNAKKLKRHIEHDVQIFQEILALVEPITSEQDTKLQTLKEWLEKPDLKSKKRLIFTQYEDTAKYLHENLNPDKKIDDIDVIYSSSGKSKALLVAKFAPKANKDYKLKADEPEINTLIATDVLAEGLNMQDGDLIINYDLHWNPVKLIQRFGRIDRISSEKETIYGFNFLPELGIERNLGLQQKLRNRIQEIHDTIGEDAAILDRNEQLNEEAMYAIYGKQSESEMVQLSLFDETEELMELTDAEEILRQLKQDHPEQYDRITKLPNGIRSARYSTKSGTYVFCEASDLNRPDIRSYQKLYLIDKQGNVISEDVSRILGSIKCEPTTPIANLPKDYNAIVMRIKKRFAEGVKHRQAERDYSSNLTQGQRYVLRELRALFNSTEDESQKTLINLLDRVFRHHLPQAINRELNAMRHNGVSGQDLFTHLVQIYNQHDLHKISDRQKSELKYQPIAAIVCSEELV